MHKLEGNKLEATRLETADDVADESTLDTVGLKQGICAQYAAGNRRAALYTP